MNNREALTKFCIGFGAEHMENEPNLHILGLSMDNVGKFKRITVINMQMHAFYRCNPFERETHSGHAY